MLFPDLQQIIGKQTDDFRLLVDSRITHHKQVEATKLEAERQRIRAEEEKRASDIFEAARLKAEQDQRAKQPVSEQRTQSVLDQVADRQSSPPITVAEVKNMLDAGPKHRPTSIEIIEVVAEHFGISVLTADEWLRDAFDRTVA